MPGPIGNSNSVTTGLTAGKLPSGCSHIAKIVKRLRTALEKATIASKGEITLTSASAINVALRAEAVVKLCQRWLCKHEGDMPHSDRLACAAKLLTASEARHRAILSLGLDVQDHVGEFESSMATESEPDDPANGDGKAAGVHGLPSEPSGTTPWSRPACPTAENRSLSVATYSISLRHKIPKIQNRSAPNDLQATP